MSRNRRGQGKKSQPARGTRDANETEKPQAEAGVASGEEQAISETGTIEAAREDTEANPVADLRGADSDAAQNPGAALDDVTTEDAPATEHMIDPEAHTPLRSVSEIAPAMHEGGLDRARTKQALESLIFVSDRIVTAVQLARSIKVRAVIVRELLAELMNEYQGRGIELIEVGGGYQFRSAPSCAPFVREFVAQKPVRLTRAQLETLALVSYRQPITRPEIDDVRGVDSGSAIRVLLERNLIKMIGRKDEPGRPLLYGTSAHFLEFFGMKSLKDLPTLREFTELSEENRALFKRKTGEDVEDTEAALAAAEERARSDEDEAEAHISDEDLAALAAEAARDELAQSDESAADEPDSHEDEEGSDARFDLELPDEDASGASIDPE